MRVRPQHVPPGAWRRAIIAVAGATACAVLAVPGAAASPGRLPSPPGTISTLAGGVGGPGPARSVAVAPCGVVSLRQLCGMAFAGGHLYTTDVGVGSLNSIKVGCVVRAIDAGTGALTTPAGNGIPGFSGDGGPASAAQFRCPTDVAVDAAGNVVIADFSNHRVRVVAASTGTFYGMAMTAGAVYTVAGDGKFVPPVSGEPALQASILPDQVAIDHSGNLIIGDLGAVEPLFASIWVVAEHTGTFYGQAMTAGDIYRIAGARRGGLGGPALKAFLGSPGAIQVDSHGNVVLAANQLERILVIAPATGTFYGRHMTAGDIYSVAGGGTGPSGTDHLGDGGPATKAIIGAPTGVAIDHHGNLVIADTNNDRVRVVAVKSGRFYGVRMRAGDIYSVAGGGRSLLDSAAAGKAFLRHPRAVAVDSAGNIAVATAFATRLRVIAERTGSFYGRHMRAGHVYTIAGTGRLWLSGNGGPATSAQLLPGPEATGRGGNLLVADATADTFRSEVRLVAASTGRFFGQQMTAGNIYTIAGLGRDGFSGDGGPAVLARLALSSHNGQGGIAAAPSGNLVIADGGNFRVRVVADRGGTFYGIAMKAGHIYTVAGNGTDNYRGDGGLATRAELDFVNGVGLAVDQFGNIAISDPTTGVVRMVADKSGTFYGVAMKADHIYRIAGMVGQLGFFGDGGPARKAMFTSPFGLAFDPAGNLVITDEIRLRVVAATTGTFYGQAMTAADVYTIAGGSPGDAGDGGPALSAALGTFALSVDPQGNLLFPENNKIRIIAAQTGTFYGLPMTVGDIYVVAGNGTAGFAGDGGPATAAELSFNPFAAANAPAFVAANASGLEIADVINARVRLVTP